MAQIDACEDRNYAGSLFLGLNWLHTEEQSGVESILSSKIKENDPKGINSSQKRPLSNLCKLVFL